GVRMTRLFLRGFAGTARLWRRRRRAARARIAAIGARARSRTAGAAAARALLGRLTAKAATAVAGRRARQHVARRTQALRRARTVRRRLWTFSTLRTVRRRAALAGKCVTDHSLRAVTVGMTRCGLTALGFGVPAISRLRLALFAGWAGGDGTIHSAADLAGPTLCTISVGSAGLFGVRQTGQHEQRRESQQRSQSRESAHGVKLLENGPVILEHASCQRVGQHTTPEMAVFLESCAKAVPGAPISSSV